MLLNKMIGPGLARCFDYIGWSLETCQVNLGDDKTITRTIE